MAIVLTSNFSDFSSNDECDISFPTLHVSGSGSFDCTNGTTSTITVSVTGGFAPYVFTSTKGVTSVVTTLSIAIHPEDNPGWFVAGNAYQYATKYTDLFCACSCINFGCNDQVTKPCNGVSCGCWPTSPYGCSCTSCTNSSDAMFTLASHWVCNPGLPRYGSGCAGLNAGLYITCDQRTGSMVSSHCEPCFITMGASFTVTVTDALSNSAFVVIPVVRAPS